MRAPARVEVDLLDLDQAHVARVVGGEAAAPDVQSLVLVAGYAPRTHGAGSTDFAHDSFLQGRELHALDCRGVELDVAVSGSQVKRRGLPAEAIGRERRDQVLRGVLLHVVEATRPVERELGRTRRHLSIDVVAQLAVEALDLDDAVLVEHPVIRRLAAALGIQDRVVQNRVGAFIVGTRLDDGHVELGSIGFALVGRDLAHRLRLCHAVPHWLRRKGGC